MFLFFNKRIVEEYLNPFLLNLIEWGSEMTLIHS